MSIPIGTDTRISLADFSGEFHELEPWQRDVVKAMAAIPPEMRDKVMIVDRTAVDGPNQATISINMGAAGGDRVIIDDSWADGEPSREERMAALDLFRPGLKLAEAARLERRELSAADLPDAPLNRAERRAQEARQRKGRRS